MMDRVESNVSRVACVEVPDAPSQPQHKADSSRVNGVTMAALAACLVAMAAFVWVAGALLGSVGMGVLLVLSLTAAFALPELLLIAFAQLQCDADARDGSGDAS
jgi:hypothetical protein